MFFLGQILVKKAKNDPRTLFERPKSDKNCKSENAEILVNSLKMAFLGIQNGKTQPFFKLATWNFVYLCIGKCSYTYILFF